MVKTFKNVLLRNQKADDIETWYKASSTQVLPGSGSGWVQIMTLGLPCPFFKIWSNLFPNASTMVKTDTAYSHIFPSLFLFSISYICTQVSDTGPMVLWFLSRLRGLTALGEEKPFQFVHDHIREQVCS